VTGVGWDFNHLLYSTGRDADYCSATFVPLLTLSAFLKIAALKGSKPAFRESMPALAGYVFRIWIFAMILD
jgi:hypothetical protein